MTATPDVLAGLRALRDLFADPERWTQRVSARDADGYVCLANAPEACQWCLMGGMDKVAGLDMHPWKIGSDTLRLRLRLQMEEKISLALAGVDLVSFNDSPSTTHAYVIAAIDRAIVLAETRLVP